MVSLPLSPSDMVTLVDDDIGAWLVEHGIRPWFANGYAKVRIVGSVDSWGRDDAMAGCGPHQWGRLGQSTRQPPSGDSVPKPRQSPILGSVRLSWRSADRQAVGCQDHVPSCLRPHRHL